MGQSTSLDLLRSDISEEEVLRRLDESQINNLRDCDKDGKNALHWASSTGILIIYIFKKNDIYSNF